MRDVVLKIIIAAAAVLSAVCIRQCSELGALTDELSQAHRNEQALIDGVRHYRTRDSLSAAKTGALELSLADARKVIGEDLEKIKNLEIKVKDMKQAAKAAIRTDINLKDRMRDTVVYMPVTASPEGSGYPECSTDSAPVVVRKMDVETKFHTVHAVLVNDSLGLDITTRDSLLIVETVQYKRFLGFLWKTKRIKNRSFDVVSLNPNTTIEDFKVVTIEK